MDLSKRLAEARKLPCVAWDIYFTILHNLNSLTWEMPLILMPEELVAADPSKGTLSIWMASSTSKLSASSSISSLTEVSFCFWSDYWLIVGLMLGCSYLGNYFFYLVFWDDSGDFIDWLADLEALNLNFCSILFRFSVLFSLVVVDSRPGDFMDTFALGSDLDCFIFVALCLFSNVFFGFFRFYFYWSYDLLFLNINCCFGSSSPEEFVSKCSLVKLVEPPSSGDLPPRLVDLNCLITLL